MFYVPVHDNTVDMSLHDNMETAAVVSISIFKYNWCNINHERDKERERNATRATSSPTRTTQWRRGMEGVDVSITNHQNMTINSKISIDVTYP